MKACLKCNEKENDDDERFCMSCGADMNAVGPPSVEEQQPDPVQNIVKKITSKNKMAANLVGRLIMPDKTIIMVDNSQRVVGRADLKKHTQNPTTIARSQFAIYKKENKYLIKNRESGKQNSSEITSLDGKKLTENETELKRGSKITVSDVEMLFEV